MKKVFFVLTIMVSFFIGVNSVSAMQIFVRTLSDRYAFDVEPTDTILNFKAKILDKLAIPVKNQVLIFPNDELENDKTFEYYNIQAEATIHLVEKYDIIVNQTTNGTITADESMSRINHTITLTVSPDNGYKLKSIATTPTVEITKVNDTTYTFIMPDEAISIDAEFQDKYSYLILDGADSEFNTNIPKDIVITIDGDYTLLDKVYVDDKVLSTDNYNVKEGSTIITLKSNYLNSLTKKTHTLKVTYTNGKEVNTTFTIKDIIKNPETNDTIINYITISFIALISLLVSSKYIKRI